MSTAQQQSQAIDALFARFDALNARVEEFKAAYMTQANPTVQTVQEPVAPTSVDSTVAERFESVQQESAAVNEFVSQFNIDELLQGVQINEPVSEPVSQPVQSVEDVNIDDILETISLDGLTIE